MPQVPTGSLLENCFVGEAIKPQTAAAAKSGDWVSLKGYEGVLFIIDIAQGNAATTAITLDAATAVAGTGNSNGKTMKRIWSITDTPQTAATAITAVTAAASVTSSATGTGSSIYLIDVKADDYPDYDCVQVELGASDVGNIAACLYICYGPRYTGSIGGIVDPRAD